jgi:hypothetical protein
MTQDPECLDAKGDPILEGDIIAVCWFDAWQDGEMEINYSALHQDRNSAHVDPHLELIDVGFFIGKKGQYLVMGFERCDRHKDYRHINFIPNCNIISIEVIKKAKGER